MDSFWVFVLATPFTVICTLLLSKWRYPRLLTLSAAGFYIIAAIVMNFIMIKDIGMMAAGGSILDLVCHLLNISLVAAAAFVLTKHSRAQTVFIVLSAYLCVYIADTVAIAITVDLWIGSDIAVLLFKLALFMFMALMLYRLRRTFWEVAECMKSCLWMHCIAQAAMLLCLIMVVSFPAPLNYAPANIPLALIIGAANIVVYGVLLYVSLLMHRQSLLESNAEAFYIYTASIERQNEAARENTEKALMFRHDIRHVSQMMSVCAENGNMEGIKELIKLLDKNVSTDGVKSNNSITGNELLDTVLNTYRNLTDESEIDLSIDIIGIDIVSADTAELAVVLANALENAVRACGMQPPGEKRSISVRGRKKGQQYFLEIANTFSGEVIFDSSNGLPVSREEGHGAGVKSTAYFAGKSGTVLQYCVENDWFFMRMLMHNRKVQS